MAAAEVLLEINKIHWVDIYSGKPPVVIQMFQFAGLKSEVYIHRQWFGSTKLELMW